MFRFYRFTLLILSIYAIFFTNTASAKEELIIAFPEEKPFLVTNGPYKGKGILDSITASLIEHLSKKFIVDVREIPFTRVMTFFKDKRNFCFGFTRKNKEREKIILYSSLYAINLPDVLIYKKGLIENKDKKNLSLKELTDSKKFVIGIEQSASYGDAIDKIIRYEKQQKPSSFFSRPGFGSRDALILMLKSNRVQAYIGATEQILFLQKITNNNDKNAVFDFSPLQENAKLIVESYIGCSKNKTGENAIKIINELLDSKDFNIKEKMIEGYRYWVDDPTQVYVKKVINQYFGKQ